MSINKDYIIQTLQKEQSYLLQRFGVLHVSLFGSFALNQQQTESDIDLLFEYDQELGMSLGRWNNLENYLQPFFSPHKIELVSKKSIHPIVLETAKPNLIEIF